MREQVLAVNKSPASFIFITCTRWSSVNRLIYTQVSVFLWEFLQPGNQDSETQPVLTFNFCLFVCLLVVPDNAFQITTFCSLVASDNCFIISVC